MTSKFVFENTKLYELPQRISRPAEACQISLQLEEMNRRVLSTLPRKLLPALIPIVGIRVKGKHTNLEEEEAQAHNTK